MSDEADEVLDPPRTSWAAPVPAVAVAVLAAVGLGAWAATTTDAPGRLLVGLAAVALAGAAAIGGFARPRLRVEDEGLVVRGPAGSRHWPWDRIVAVRVVRMKRLGVPASYVEVEARPDGEGDPGRLLVLGRLELGEDPVEVAAALQAHRADAGRRARRARSAGQQKRPHHDRDDQNDADPDGDQGAGPGM